MLPEPDDLADLPLDEAPLPPVPAQLLRVARALLAPAGLVVRAHQLVPPLGLRLYLGPAASPTSPETGQLVLHFDQQGRWMRTAVAGRRTPLARAAARRLVAPGTVPVLPLW